jgi:outer membrane protein OmpA-like peptidoglycan-associated protein
MKNMKWMALVSLPVLALGSAAVWGDSCNNQSSTSSSYSGQQMTKSAEELGLYVDHDQALAMGGVGNYVTPSEAKHYDEKVAETESLRNQVATTEKRLPPVAEANKDQGVVFFPFGKADLTPDGKAEISSLSSELKQDSDLAIEVNGYTDSLGGPNVNEKLSAQRADAVKSELLSHGVAPEQIRTYAYGENEPIASNDTATGRAVNRRAEVYIENATDTG